MLTRFYFDSWYVDFLLKLNGILNQHNKDWLLLIFDTGFFFTDIDWFGNVQLQDKYASFTIIIHLKEYWLESCLLVTVKFEILIHTQKWDLTLWFLPHNFVNLLLGICFSNHLKIRKIFFLKPNIISFFWLICASVSSPLSR